MMTHSPGVFISHSWKDKDFARKLASDLLNVGAKVWIDEAEIAIGESLIEKIRKGIDETDYMIVILSHYSIQSEWVKREVDVALNQEIEGKKVKVLPLLIEPCDLPGFLKGKLHGDFTSPDKYQLSFQRLLAALGLTQHNSDASNDQYPTRTNEHFKSPRAQTSNAMIVIGFEGKEFAEHCYAILEMAQRDGYVMLHLGSQHLKQRAGQALARLGAVELVDLRPHHSWSKYTITELGAELRISLETDRPKK